MAHVASRAARIGRIMQKIHFIRNVDQNNAGDYFCSPLGYYWDFFKNYAVVQHDMGAVRFHEIHRSDVVIFGGGGVINYCEAWNKLINRMFETAGTVIGWGIGFNSHLQGYNP